MFNYDRIAAIALTQINRFGLAITLTHRGAATYDIATSTVVPGETTETTVGVLDSYKNTEIDGTLIQQGDLKLLLPANITRPTNNDLAALADGTKYTIKNVEIVAPGGTAVLYVCQVRK